MDEKVLKNVPCDSLAINCDYIYLYETSTNLKIEVPKEKIEQLDYLIINGIKFKKEKRKAPEVYKKELYKPIKPIDISYTCTICGEKRTITCIGKGVTTGKLLSDDLKPCAPYIKCPKCKKLTMVEDKSE